MNPFIQISTRIRNLFRIAKQNDVAIGLCYGSLAFFLSILHNIFVLYHVETFVSIYKIDKTSFWIGETVFLVWNCVNDPIFGWFSDRDYLNSGTSTSKDADDDVVLARLRTLMWSGPCFAVSFAVLWTRWGYPSVQFVFCLCLYDGFLTLIDLHHSALLADLHVSNEERTKLNSYCSVFSGLGSVSVFGSYVFWSREEISAFRPYCFVLAAVAFVGFSVVCLFFRSLIKTRRLSPSSFKLYPVTDGILESSAGSDDVARSESFSRKASADQTPSLRRCPSSRSSSISSQSSHDSQLEKPLAPSSSSFSSSSSSSPRQFLLQLSRHRNFLWFSAMNVLQCLHCHFNSNFFPLFMDALLGDRISPRSCSFLLGLSFVVPHVNNLYFLTLCRRLGAYGVIRRLFYLKILLGVAMLTFWTPDDTWMLCAFLACNRVFTEGTCKLLNLVVSDLVDEDRVINARRQNAAALIFGSAAFFSKPGQTLAPLIGTWLIGVQTGNDVFAAEGEWSVQTESEMQSMETRAGIFQILVYLPIVIASVQIFCWSKFSLHGNRLNEVKRIRRESSGNFDSCVI